MRPPARPPLTLLSISLLVLASASAASAEDVAISASVDPVRLDRFVSNSVDLDDAYAAVGERIDERLALALSGPTSMECTKSAEAGLETCVVRAQGATSVPASLARN